MKRLMLVVAAMTAASAFADRVIMKSGSVLTGSGAVVSGFVSVFCLVSDQISAPIAAARNRHPIASHSFLFFIKTFLLKYK